MDKGLTPQNTSLKKREDSLGFDDLVLDKDIFSNIFEKDIRRIYIYKKSERIAKALHLISPAFRDSRSLRDRLDRIAVALIDASVRPPAEARDSVAREILALQSVLAMAKSGGLLSPMNADIIMREAHNLLQEVASYEVPRVFLDDMPSLAVLAKSAAKNDRVVHTESPDQSVNNGGEKAEKSKGQIKDMPKKKGREEEILSILTNKGSVYIKDISMLIRGVSEKTIQRELQALVLSGKVTRTGERRWTTYSIKV